MGCPEGENGKEILFLHYIPYAKNSEEILVPVSEKTGLFLGGFVLQVHEMERVFHASHPS